jgi:hypothetical protein
VWAKRCGFIKSEQIGEAVALLCEEKTWILSADKHEPLVKSLDEKLTGLCEISPSLLLT